MLFPLFIILFAGPAWSQVALDPGCLTNMEAFEKRWVSSGSAGHACSLEEGPAAVGPFCLVQRHPTGDGWSYWAPRERETTTPNRLVNWVSLSTVVTNIEITFLYKTEKGARGDGGVFIQCVAFQEEGRVVYNQTSETFRSEGAWRRGAARFVVPKEAKTYEVRFGQRNLSGESRIGRLGCDWQWSSLEPWTFWDFDGYTLGEEGWPPWLTDPGKGGASPKRWVDDSTGPMPRAFSLKVGHGSDFSFKPSPVSRFGSYRLRFHALPRLPSKLAVGLDYLDTRQVVVRKTSHTIILKEGGGPWTNVDVPFQVDSPECHVRPRFACEKGDGELLLSMVRLTLDEPVPPVKRLQQMDGGGGWNASWISTQTGLDGTNRTPGRFAFGTTFRAPSNVSALRLQVMGDDRATVCLDGERLAETRYYRDVAVVERTQGLGFGPHRLTVVLEDDGGLSGLQLEADLCRNEGDSIKVMTGSNWWVAPVPNPGMTCPQVEALPKQVPVVRPSTGGTALDEVPYRLFSETGVVRLIRLNSPGSVKAGESLTIEGQWESPLPAGAGNMQWLISGPGLDIRSRVRPMATGPSNTFSFSWVVPEWLEGGDIRLSVKVPGVRVAGSSSVGVKVIPSGKKPGYPRMSLTNPRGIVNANRNGIAVPLVPVDLGDLDPIALESMAQQGFDCFVVDVGDMGWKGEGRYDDRELFDNIRRVLAVRPDAKLVLQVPLETSTFHGWWVDRYPDAWARGEEGQPIYVSVRGRSNKAPSFTSPRFRRDFGETLRRLVQVVGASPYADHVVMVRLLSGAQQQWLHWGAPQEIFSDYNPSNRDGFRAFLRQAYQTNGASLSVAWGKPGLDFDRVELPRASARTQGVMGIFRDGKIHRPLIDFDTWHQRVPFETLEYFARVVKDASGGRLLTAAPYGWQMGYAPPWLGHEGGQWNLRQALRSPWLDVISGAAVDRVAGSTGGVAIPLASLNLWNKMYLNHFDMRTFWRAGPSRNPPELDEDLQVLRRDAIQSLLSGSQFSWEEGMTRELSGDPRFGREMQAWASFLPRLQERCEAAPTAVCLYVDDASIPVTSLSEKYGWLPASFQYQIRSMLIRSGVKVEIHSLADLDHPGYIPTGKVHLFANTFLIRSNQRQWIRDRLMKPGNAVVYFHGAGAFTSEGDGPRVENMSSLTGIDLAQGNGETLFATRGIGAEPRVFPARSGISRSNAPFYSVSDPRAIPLGVWADRTNDASIAVKEVGGASVYMVGTPSLSPAVLRGICRKAGVFVYSDSEEAIYPAENMVGMHTRFAGRKEISFPKGEEVVEVFSGKKYPLTRGRLAFDAEGKTTYLFVVGKDGGVLADGWR